VAVVVAFAVAAICAPLAARVALRLGVVDHPGPLKVQAEPIPYLGGVAVLAGVAGPVAWARPWLLVPLLLAGALGLADDVGDLPARVRMACELLIGVVAVACLPTRGVGGAVLVVAAVVLLVNAVNLLDGLDGLACGVGAVSAAGFAVLLDGDFRVVALAVTAALAGVLLWNRPPARIYLGDAGSYALGTALALLFAAAYAPGESGATSSAALLLVAVPVADTTVAIVRRLRAKRPLFHGDRGHVYDQLVDRGWAPVSATAACVGAQAVLAGAAIGAAQLSTVAAVFMVGALIAVVGIAALVAFTAPRTWVRNRE
jgi:UDP-GlcNAc:undecaprenyl-phosphate GlcNAc-1-phosphate transferase